MSDKCQKMLKNALFIKFEILKRRKGLHFWAMVDCNRCRRGMQAFPLCSHVCGALLCIATPSLSFNYEKKCLQKGFSIVMYRRWGQMLDNWGKSLLEQEPGVLIAPYTVCVIAVQTVTRWFWTILGRFITWNLAQIKGQVAQQVGQPKSSLWMQTARKTEPETENYSLLCFSAGLGFRLFSTLDSA